MSHRSAPLELLIARHGESEGNRDGSFTGHGPSALTERGRAQAEALGVALSASPPDAIYVSDLPRARQTAEPLCRITGLTPVLSAEIRERNMGDLTGVRFEDVKAQQPEVWKALLERDRGFAPPNGESHRECAARVARFLDALREAHPTGRVVLVSHGVAMHHMIVHLLGVTAPELIVSTDNCAVHRLELRARSVRIISLNDTRHLAGV